MCTAILGIGPDGTILLAGVRDEFVSRAWQPPGQHWPDVPGVIGGRDLLAGGTWLAVAPAVRRVACVLNGLGQMAPAGARQSRGVLPLAAADGKLSPAGPADLAAFDRSGCWSRNPAARSWATGMAVTSSSASLVPGCTSWSTAGWPVTWPPARPRRSAGYRRGRAHRGAGRGGARP